MRGPSKDRLVFEVPNKSQTQREYVMDVVDHLSGLLAIVVFVASLSVYCTWSFHVAFNWDWVGNSYSWGLSEDAQSWVSWEFAKPGATNTLVLSERPVGTTASSTLLCALFDDFFFSQWSYHWCNCCCSVVREVQDIEIHSIYWQNW